MKLIFAERLGPWLARHPKALDRVWRLEAWLVRGLIRLFQGLGPERSGALAAADLRAESAKEAACG
jgi:hypothetical protein